MIYKIKQDSSREYVAPDGEVVEIPIAANSVIQTNGPVIPVFISHPLVITGKDKENPPPLFTALIDTGAAVSVITPKVVKYLDLIKTGYTHVASVHNVEERPVYFGRITFPWGGGIETSLVSCEL